MVKKIIYIEQEPGKVKDAPLYKTQANVWFDEGETIFYLENTKIGEPTHYLIYEKQRVSRGKVESILVDIGHGLEDASKKAYELVLESGKERVKRGEEISGDEVCLVDKTIRGEHKID